MSPTSPTDTLHVPLESLHAFAYEALRSCGVRPDQADMTAGALAETDAFGVSTHGTKLLAGYLHRVRAGGIRTDDEPTVLRGGPAWALVDGRSTLGQVVGMFAMDEAIQRARRCGIAYVGVQNGNHFGAAGQFALRAARAGCIGLAMCNDIPSVAAPGSRQAITGTNPLAYAVPAGDLDPIFYDAAISTVAGGKVYMARTLGRPIPGDWLIGPDGRPTSDATLYPDRAALAPMAGHKGYGLGLLIETLSGVLAGGAITWEVGNWIWGDRSQPTRHGAAFLAVDVDAIDGDRQFASRIRQLIDEIHAAPTADGVERVLLPGELEWGRRAESLRRGVGLPPDVVEKLREAAEIAQVRPDWLGGG